VVRPLCGHVLFAVVEPLVGGDPVKTAPHARVIEHAEANEGEHHVAREARDDGGGETAAGLLAALVREAA
jgi:hypothetical protein